MGSITVRMEGWNTYLLFMENFGMENWVGVRGGGEGGRKLCFVLQWCYNRHWTRVGRVGQKVLFRTS